VQATPPDHPSHWKGAIDDLAQDIELCIEDLREEAVARSRVLRIRRRRNAKIAELLMASESE
jgi:hypothetical protein